MFLLTYLNLDCSETAGLPRGDIVKVVTGAVRLFLFGKGGGMEHQRSIKILVRLVIIILIVGFLPHKAISDVPDKITYQGYIADTNGNPMADGDYPMGFAIHGKSSRASSAVRAISPCR